MRIVRVFVVALALGVAGCSTSKSAESEEGGEEAASEEANAEASGSEEEASEGEGAEDEESGESGKVTKAEMHEKHRALLERYEERSETYKKRVEGAESKKLRGHYRSLMEEHEAMLAGEHHAKKKEGGEGEQGKSEDGEKGDGGSSEGPSRDHVLEMAKLLSALADLHEKAAGLEADAGREELEKHHQKMAEGHVELAEMHRTFADQLESDGS